MYSTVAEQLVYYCIQNSLKIMKECGKALDYLMAFALSILELSDLLSLVQSRGTV
jgi:hypothetical protein